MNKVKRSKLGLSLSLLVTLLLPSVSFAQDDETTAADKTNSAAATQSAGNTDDAAPPTASGDSKRSPSDYKSSEEISEDLSVSFPVDI